MPCAGSAAAFGGPGEAPLIRSNCPMQFCFILQQEMAYPPAKVRGRLPADIDLGLPPVSGALLPTTAALVETVCFPRSTLHAPLSLTSAFLCLSFPWSFPSRRGEGTKPSCFPLPWRGTRGEEGCVGPERTG